MSPAGASDFDEKPHETEAFGRRQIDARGAVVLVLPDTS